MFLVFKSLVLGWFVLQQRITETTLITPLLVPVFSALSWCIMNTHVYTTTKLRCVSGITLYILLYFHVDTYGLCNSLKSL